jgi:hypothetical protein
MPRLLLMDYTLADLDNLSDANMDELDAVEEWEGE